MSFGLNNDSFGCIAEGNSQMDIDNQSNTPSIQDNFKEYPYHSLLVNNKIQQAVKTISDILSHKYTRITHQSLLSIPNKVFSLNEYNSLKSSIIIKRLNRGLNVLLAIYRSKQVNLLYHRFTSWIRKTKLELYLNQSKALIEAHFVTQFNNKKNEVEALVNSKQNEIDQIKERIILINEAITKWNKTIKSYEDKETTVTKSIKGLQDDNTRLEEEIRKNNKMNDNTSINNKKVKLDAKISELEQTIKNLEDEIKEKDNNIVTYVKEMNDMLDIFEQKANEINSSKEDKVDRHKWKSPTNPRTNSFKNSFNVLPNNSGTNTNTNINNANSSINTNQNHSQQKFSGQNQSKQGLKIHNTINTKGNQSATVTNNNTNTSRGTFINITANHLNHKK